MFAWILFSCLPVLCLETRECSDTDHHLAVVSVFSAIAVIIHVVIIVVIDIVWWLYIFVFLTSL